MMNNVALSLSRQIALLAIVVSPVFFPGDAAAQEELPGPLPLTEQVQLPIREDPPVNPDLASWFEAGSGNALGNQIRGNWVMLGQAGELTGTVSGALTGAVALNIYALNRGKVVSQTRTDASGNFRMDGLTQGAYTIVGYSPNSFFAYGVSLLEHRAGATNVPRRLSSQALNIMDKQPICRLILDHSPNVQFRSFGKYPFSEEDPGKAAYFGWDGLAAFNVKSFPATTIQSRVLRLGPDGLLRGRIHQIDHLSGRPLPVSQTRVMLVEQGQIVVETDCNRYGVFEFTGMPSGEFGLVAVGSDGFAAMGVQLVGGLDGVSQKLRGSKSRFVSTKAPNQQAASFVDLSLVQTESIGWINHHLGENQFAEARSRPRSQQNSGGGVCCVHCLEIIIPGNYCGCHR